MRMTGQIRASHSAVLGWDMSAAFALGAALGVPGLIIAELLPVIESEMVRKTNEQISQNEDRGDGY